MSIANLLTTPFSKLVPYKRATTHLYVHKGLAIQEDKPKDIQQQERTFQVVAPTRAPNTSPNPVAYSHINWSLVFIFLVFASLKLTHK